MANAKTLHDNLVHAFKAIQSAGKSGSTGGSGNVAKMTARIGKAEYVLTVRDLGQPDTYSREDLVVMLRTIRSEEIRTDWTVPEPGVCIRSAGHDGPCNGLPRKDCPGYAG